MLKLKLLYFFLIVVIVCMALTLQFSNLAITTNNTNSYFFTTNDIKFEQTALNSDNQKLQNLGKLIFDRICRLQHPKDCNSAKFLRCSTGKTGLASQLHLLSDCCLLALGTNRTLLYDYEDSAYAGIRNIFVPWNGNFCLPHVNTKAIEWKGELHKPLQENISVLHHNSLDFKHFPKTNFIPFNMPKTVAETLEQLRVEDPNAWWIGQILKYFVRFSPWMKQQLNERKAILNFSRPIVGIHIRRTDKGKKFHQPIANYMLEALTWWKNYVQKTGYAGKKRFYIASDSFEVIAEIKQKFSGYEVLFNENAQEDVVQKERYKDNGMIAYMTDIAMLKDCDFVVGTFTSNCGRLIYESFIAEGRPKSDFKSLQWEYNHHKRYPQWHVAIETHEPSEENEIELEVGDEIRFGEAPLGKGYGINQRTGYEGYYPLQKVRKIIKTANYEAFT